MNNEIKFRVWLNDTKKFKTFPQEYVGNRCAHLCMSSEQEDSFGVYVIESTKNRIYQMWTGLKDKNGKDVYVGDILKGKYYWDSPEIIDAVTFENFSFICRYNLDCFKGGIEIIGNIFENPELLKDETLFKCPNCHSVDSIYISRNRWTPLKGSLVKCNNCEFTAKL